jgi:hypothetical protein
VLGSIIELSLHQSSACVVPDVQISKTASQRMGVDSLAIVSMIAAAVGLHIVLLSTNTLACR